MALAEKGAGDLPDRGVFHYLRPFGVQMDAEYLPRWTGSQLDLVAFDSALSYQLDYLSGPGSDFGADSPLRPLVFFNEFNYQQMAWGHRNHAGRLARNPPVSPTRLGAISSRPARNWV
jgi:hypothetical protein